MKINKTNLLDFLNNLHKIYNNTRAVDVVYFDPVDCTNITRNNTYNIIRKRFETNEAN